MRDMYSIALLIVLATSAGCGIGNKQFVLESIEYLGSMTLSDAEGNTFPNEINGYIFVNNQTNERIMVWQYSYPSQNSQVELVKGSRYILTWKKSKEFDSFHGYKGKCVSITHADISLP